MGGIWEKMKIAKQKSIFIDCCNLLGEILLKFHNEDIQDKFFEEVFDIFRTTIISTSQQDPSYFKKFESFLYTILTKINNYSNILNVDNFMYLIENFNQDIKLNICYAILSQIIDSSEKIADPYLAFSLLKIGKYIHDSLEITSPEVKKKEVSYLLNQFIKKVDFGLDYENLLNFFTEARGAYSDLEETIELLVLEVQRICLVMNKIVKGKHNKKTIRFCKVCIAYCQITIPSIRSHSTQLKLLLWTSQIALTNNLISECDSLLKHIITILAKIVNDNTLKIDNLNYLNNFVNNLISFLVVVPSNPESPFQLIQGLMNVFRENQNM
jgi:hypothetical protein